MPDRPVPGLDYHALLRKYLHYVQEVEGADFVTVSDRSSPHNQTQFTPEDWAELEAIGNEP